MHALIIEDSVLIAMVVEDHLRELGYTTIDVADRHSAAISLAQAQRPDLIVADDGLVEGSGIEAAAQICAEKAVPTVLMLGDPERAKEGTQLVHACVLPKPFIFETFEAAVSQANELASAPDPH